IVFFFFFQAEDGIRDFHVTGVQTCALPIFYERLREEGYLCKSGESRNRPTQRAMDMGLFEVIERTGQAPDGAPRVNFTTKVTGKGQQYFIDRYAPRAILDVEVLAS